MYYINVCCYCFKNRNFGFTVNCLLLLHWTVVQTIGWLLPHPLGDRNFKQKGQLGAELGSPSPCSSDLGSPDLAIGTNFYSFLQQIFLLVAAQFVQGSISAFVFCNLEFLSLENRGIFLLVVEVKRSQSGLQNRRVRSHTLLWTCYLPKSRHLSAKASSRERWPCQYRMNVKCIQRKNDVVGSFEKQVSNLFCSWTNWKPPCLIMQKKATVSLVWISKQVPLKHS